MCLERKLRRPNNFDQTKSYLWPCSTGKEGPILTSNAATFWFCGGESYSISQGFSVFIYKITALISKVIFFLPSNLFTYSKKRYWRHTRCHAFFWALGIQQWANLLDGERPNKKRWNTHAYRYISEGVSTWGCAGLSMMFCVFCTLFLFIFY